MRTDYINLWKGLHLMKKFRLLIVDDDFVVRKPRWERLFPEASAFSYAGPLSAEEFLGLANLPRKDFNNSIE